MLRRRVPAERGGFLPEFPAEPPLAAPSRGPPRPAPLFAESPSLLPRSSCGKPWGERVACRALELVQPSGEEMVRSGYHEKRPAACRGDLPGALFRTELVVPALDPHDACRPGDRHGTRLDVSRGTRSGPF